MNHSSFTGTIRSNQGAGWQVGGGEGGASDPENADGGEGEGGAAAASGPEGGVLRCPEERDGGRSEEQGTGKCLLVIVGREEGDFGKGERDWGSNWAVLFVFWGWVFFFNILQHCNKGNNSYEMTDTVNVYNFIYLSKENKYLAVFLQIVDIYVVKVFNFIYESFYYRPIAWRL